MQQKRTYKRFSFKSGVELKTADRKTSPLNASIDDIGLGGFRLRSLEELEIGSKVKFAVMTPFLDRPLMGKGRVKYLKYIGGYGRGRFSAGVQFTRVNRSLIKYLIDKTQGWRNRGLLPYKLKRELGILLRLLPIVLLAIYLIIKACTVFSGDTTGFSGQGYAQPSRINIIVLPELSRQQLAPYPSFDSFRVEMYDDYSGVVYPTPRNP
ncbi:MAG: PilZ domain-containing protein [Candidatus Omnitrophica bacterium]|nr:PilZ domain-containing protein [Candidatus Omnitrophota bacterium]